MNGIARGKILNYLKRELPRFTNLSFAEREKFVCNMLSQHKRFSIVNECDRITGAVVRKQVLHSGALTPLWRAMVDYLCEFHGYVDAGEQPKAVEFTEVVVDELSDMTDAGRETAMSHDAVLKALVAAFPTFKVDNITTRRERIVRFVSAHPGVAVFDEESRREIHISGSIDLDALGSERFKLAVEYLVRFHDYVVMHTPDRHDAPDEKSSDEAFVAYLQDLDNALKSIDFATKEMRKRTWDAQILSEIATYRAASTEIITKLRELGERLKD